ncbi:MAG: calcium-binding protein, partial [Planktomarina sp.]
NVDVPAGMLVGFVVLVDGFAMNDFDQLGIGSFALAEVTGNSLALVHDDGAGTVTQLSGDVLLSTHANTATGHLLGTSNIVEIGFEDGWGGNDGDFNDVVFHMDVGAQTAAALAVSTSSNEDDRLEGQGGADVISGGIGADLLVGGGSGAEWQLVDGEWIYNADLVAPDDGSLVWDTDDDLLIGGDGNDVLLGNRGDDTLRGGGGDDVLNGGRGQDDLMGGDGADILNLEDGDDFGVGGDGADIINAGAGDDVLYGDLLGQNLLAGPSAGVIDELAAAADWDLVQNQAAGSQSLTQTISTQAGQNYSFSIDLAANLSSGSTGGLIEVFWDGQLIDTVQVDGALYETLTTGFQAQGNSGVLEIRSSVVPGDGSIDASGMIATTAATLSTAMGVVDVAGFAAGQNHLYQVLDGQLTIFDTASQSYVTVGDDPGFRTNAVGYNVEDNLIYAVAGQSGVDSTGMPVSVDDLIVYDAAGDTFRVGATTHHDFVGDFDDQGNLWTFDISLDRVTMIDVDNINPDGTMVSTDFAMDPDLFPFRIYDVAFDASSQSFLGVKGAPDDGGAGMLVQIDVSDVAYGGDPVVTTLPITGTMIGTELIDGMPKGSFGAVFLDGAGNLFVSLNKGDHDIDGSTPNQGAIYQVQVNPDSGGLYLEFIASTSATTSNDGAMDPRGTQTFAGIDVDAELLVQNLMLNVDTGDGDKLRGAAGDDTIYGGGGDDLIHAGDDDDLVFGDHGADLIFGGTGHDDLRGGLGDDHVEAGQGDDQISGGLGNDVAKGEDGDDRITGGFGDDVGYGGRGADVMVFDQGADRGFGGAGDDALYGGTGIDHLDGGSGDDIVDVGAGDDFAKGGDGRDTLDGGSGHDLIYGDQGDDVVSGGTGDDKLHGNVGDDTLLGGDGDDTLKGGEGADTLAGDGGDDLLFSGAGNDLLRGGDGDDHLVGGAGSDIIEGGAGTDHLWGGTFIHDNSADIFVYSTGGGKDMIHDFETQFDQIDLSSFGMTFEQLQDRFVDLGWATEIDLSDLAGGEGIDRILIRSVEITDLAEDNFIL